MKFPRMAKTVAFVKNLLGEKDIPVAEGKVAFSDEHTTKLKKTLGEDGYNQLVDAFNKEISTVLQNEDGNQEMQQLNEQLADLQSELSEILDETSLSAEEKKELLKGKSSGDEPSLSDQIGAVKTQLGAIKKVQDDQKKLVNKLMNDPEVDSPEAIIKRNVENMQHSKTHLFASGKKYDAFEGRGWNQRLRDQSVKATDFNDETSIPLLQDDLKHFVRENPTELESLFADFEDLPAEWDRRSGVLDRIATATIIAGEIVQGRKKGWAPKNKFKISAEEGKVFRKKIDIEFDGYELQEIENTWIRSYNKAGSHPWKMSFIGFLLSEIVKQQKLDDRRAQINGIFAQTPEGDGIPGAAVNSQDGLRFLQWYYRDVVKKYRPFNLGEPTKANIVDYIKKALELIPEEYRNRTGMEIELSSELLQWYRDKAGTIYQLHKSGDEGKMQYGYDHPIDYPNWKFQEIKDQTKSKFIFFTASKNVQIMDYNANEKGKFTITHERRDTSIFADYRLGIRLKFVGTKLKAGETADFERQVVWSNDMPIFDSSVFVPVYDDETGVIDLHYNTMKVDKAWTTDITEIDNATPGQIVRIIGNTSMAGAKNVTADGNIAVASNFNLKLGGTLTLFVNADGSLKEIGRTNEPAAVVNNDKFFTGDTIDANLSNEFFYTGAASEELADIVNGVDGKVIKIYGKDAAGVTFTVAAIAGKVSVASNAVLATSEDFIELIRVDGVWTEVSRTIA